ncbi:MAG: sigma 54-interacting transcriptional regulator [Anaerovoracaceae bacterium]|nr:sigma 54-interacting transcriptional regulator [Anaerovoracaceae bacterium]
MLRKYVEQILNIYNYIDGLMITDKDGKIVYYKTYRPDLINLKENKILGKNVLSIYPNLTSETSSIMRVLKTGEPIYNEKQYLESYDGQKLNVVNTTLPIVENDRIVGVIDVSQYMDPSYQRKEVVISMASNKGIKNLYEIDDIISNSKSMESLKSRIPMVASTDSSVLIYGETGTGKELVAQSIHTSSTRKQNIFVSQNCAAIPGNLLEGILFGTTKGSYTGAENKPGLFEIANGGTLFLDEINSMDIGVQSKLLKAIEEKQVTRIGGYKPIKTNIKILSAVNEDPLVSVREKRLREDLFYRLSAVQLNIPPLRERGEDLSYLVKYFIKEFNQKMNRDVLDIDSEVEWIFKNYSWPGNVRELRNIIEGAFNVSSNRIIRKRDIAEYVYRKHPKSEFDNFEDSNQDLILSEEKPFSKSLPEMLEEYERKILIYAISNSSSFVEAAEKLQITKQSLNYKLNKYNIKE